MDPDPRIRTTGLRIRIMLFSSVAFKMLTKYLFFPPKFCYLLLTVARIGTHLHVIYTDKVLFLFFTC
jgi:hypothetical protein